MAGAGMADREEAVQCNFFGAVGPPTGLTARSAAGLPGWPYF